MDYNQFCKEMEMCKAYIESAKKLQDEIDLLFYDMENVKAIRYDKERGSSDARAIEIMKLTQIEQKAQLEKELDHTELVRKEIEAHLIAKLSDLPEEIGIICLEKYGLEMNGKRLLIAYPKGKTFKEIGKEYGYSDHGLWQRVRKEIEKL